jgi:hypothetical protein
VLRHWNGTSWGDTALPLVALRPVFVAGTSASSVFVAQDDGGSPAIEHLWHFDGASWAEVSAPGQGITCQGIALTPSGQLVCVGSGTLFAPGQALRFYSAGRSAKVPDPPVPDIMDVWAHGRDFVVGAGWRQVMIWDGMSWKQTNLGAGSDLTAVWGTSPTDFYVAGPAEVEHYTSVGWTVETGITGLAPKIAGASASSVFIASTKGVFLRDPQDGTWHQQTTPDATTIFRDLWAASDTSVYAVGDGGAIVHYNGSTWEPMTSGTTQALYSVWGSSDTDVYAINGGSMFHFDGTAWSPVALPALAGDMIDISGAGPDDVWVLRDTGSPIHYDGARWAPVNIGISGADTTPTTIFVESGQWVIGGKGPVFGTDPPAMIAQFLRTGPGGIGK